MAVPEQTPYIEHIGNGVTTSFSLGFQCESKDHLIVLVDEVEPSIATWSLTGGNVVFTTAPAAGKKITVQRNTPFSRTTDYQSYNNSFRPPAVNKDFDWIWLKLQELGVADWILSNRIDALKNYVDDRDDELRSYLLEEIRKQGVALDQLDDYYNYLMQRLAQIAVDKGWDASFVVDASGKTQQQINDVVGAPWYPKPGGYPVGARVTRTHGALVRSVVPNNTNNPNENMTGWVRHHNTVYADEYGILPNQTEDQTLLIDAAVADTASKGLELRFGPGEYIIDPLKFSAAYPWNSTFGLNIYSGMNIVGEGAIFKIKDGSSTLEVPKWYSMFFTDTYKKDWDIQGIIFNGNWTNNRKPVNTTYNQAFIGVFGNNGRCDNVTIKRNIFKNNGGLNNVITGVSYFASQGQGTMELGENWDVSENWHLNCGMDSSDFTAVFGMCDNMKCDNSWYINDYSATGVSAAGPRNAFEVHGSNQTFNNNFIKSYYSGMIVNSNYTRPCENIQVNNNIMVNMYQGGIRLWRAKTTAVSETPIHNVQIKGNQIHLNGNLFGANDVYKGGIWATDYSSLSIDGVEIEGNTVTVDSYMRNLTAGVLITPDAAATTEWHLNWKIKNNIFIGTYNGVYVELKDKTPSMRGLVVEGNEHRKPLNVVSYTEPTSYVFKATGNSAIHDLVYRNNRSIDSKNGVRFEGNILDITEEDNYYRGVSIVRTETSLNNNIRRGDNSAPQHNLISTQNIKGWNLLQRKGFKVRVDYTKFAASIYQALMTLPPKARISDLIADIVTPFAGTAEPTLRVGTANGGNQYLLLTPADTAKQVGNNTADLGALLTGGKNGQFANWTGFSNVIASLGGTGTPTAGVVDFYIVVEYL